MHHGAAVLALSPGAQPDPVIAPAVRARLTLHQATPRQPRERAVDQGLAAGLLQPAGEPVGQSHPQTKISLSSCNGAVFPVAASDVIQRYLWLFGPCELNLTTWMCARLT
ncbi:hypothetical protein [Streptomyces sp. NRRL S-1022]|uniref:hypothetical protein n=1 Tax=Streptomyces sp. NRRL S-1022 TaxID=1463880 RepID=UPI0004BF79EA|nr:hypothetical protein [Streptomyces sp. NRRL S-1022]